MSEEKHSDRLSNLSKITQPVIDEAGETLRNLTPCIKVSTLCEPASCHVQTTFDLPYPNPVSANDESPVFFLSTDTDNLWKLRFANKKKQVVKAIENTYKTLDVTLIKSLLNTSYRSSTIMGVDGNTKFKISSVLSQNV